MSNVNYGKLVFTFLLFIIPIFSNGQITYKLVSEAASYADSEEPLDWQSSYGTLVVDYNKNTFSFYQDEVIVFHIIKTISRETTPNGLATMYSFDCVSGNFKWRIMLRIPIDKTDTKHTVRIINLETFDSLYYNLKQL